MNKLILKPHKELSLGRHPWIFSGAIARVEGDPESGETVEVESYNGDTIALAAFSPSSSIRARVWSFDPNEKIDEDFFRRRITGAFRARDSFINDKNTNAYRIVYSEADLLPGLIADKYDNYIVIQILSSGAEKWRDTIVKILAEIIKPAGIFERSEIDVRKLEGLEPRTGCLWGTEPEEKITIVENGLKYVIDIKAGQKTGFYLDQRSNRFRVREFAAEKKILDAYSYTGGFAMNCLAAGAESVSVIESSAEALSLLETNVSLNGFGKKGLEVRQGNASELFRKFRDEGRKFDMIILDPPKFAPTVASLDSAVRGYKDINLLAMKLLTPGGVLFTFSCSGAMNIIRFIEMLGYAATDAGIDAQIIEFLSQAPDHPISPVFPESFYLKGCILKIS
jgi:23S rRNA (cytosine1962-C5)-methyltransferase